MVLTEAVRRYLFDHQPPGVPLAVIPCCADVPARDRGDEASPYSRDEFALGDRPVMAYVGKFSGWYMEREMVDFYCSARPFCPGLLFLVVTQSDRALIEAEFRRARIPPSDYVITRVEPSEVERYLAAADFGISFVRPSFSKISSSPTKVAEYLAAGVPVVTTRIGDLADLFANRSIGVLVDEFSPAGYEAAVIEVESLAGDAATPKRCRMVARQRLSLKDVGIPAYDRLYRAVAGRADD